MQPSARSSARSGVVLSVIVLVAGVAAPRAARAQAPAPSAPPAASAPSSGNDTEARLHFVAGVNLLRDPAGARYEEAYIEFKRAYALVPSYKILGNLGLCALRLERDGEAIDAYTRYLAEATDLEPEERAQAERDLMTLRVGVGYLTLESQPDGAMIVDSRVPVNGTPITNTYGPLRGATKIGVRQGHHVVTARFPDGKESRWEVDVRGDDSHVFVPPVEAPAEHNPNPVRTSRPIPRTVLVAGGATAVVGLGALVTGLVALGTHSKFQSANDGTDPTRASNLRSSGTTLNVVTDVLLAATVVGAGVTTYLYLRRPTVTEAASAGAGAPTAGVFVGPTGVAGFF